MSEIEKNVNRIINLHVENLESNKRFSNALLEILDLCSKDGAVFINGETLKRLVHEIKSHGELAERHLKTFKKNVEQCK